MSSPDHFTGRMLIDGELVESVDGGWLESINPANEQPLGRVPMGSAADMQRAVAAAEAAQPAWAALPIAQRAALLNRLADAVSAEAEGIARLEAMDTGNTLGPMLQDVRSAADRIRYAAGLASEIKGQTIPASPGSIHMTLRVPYGVIGRIVAFNHPFGFAASRIGPALIAGNALVLKPSEQSPLSAARLAEICARVLPRGVVNIVTGGRATGEALVRHPKVKRLGLIGSAAAGMAIQKAAAETAVKHVTLELGGKNPLVAFADADVDRVAQAAVDGMNFSWQGQSCGSTSRILLHEDIHDAVVERILDRVRAIRLGDPLDPATTMGPINSRAQYDKVLSYIALGREEGATLVAGGGRPKGPGFERGFWIEPTVFTGVDMSMRVAREEIFGPVMAILRFRSEQQAIAMANDVELGLTAAVWTRDIDRAMRVAQRIDAGYVWVNGVGAHYRGVPYGGLKNSGVGREECLEEILSCTEEKVINLMVAPASGSEDH
jgi:betaine-aldehyde dehydrogenase